MSNIHLRMITGLLAGAVVALAALLVWHSGGQRAAADTPHPGLDFAIGIDSNGDTTDDCDTKPATGTGAKCTFASGGLAFKLRFYLDARGGLAYAGYDSTLQYGGVTTPETAQGTGVGNWPDCVFFAANFMTPGVAGIGCAVGVGAPGSTFTGLMYTADFNCAASGSIALVQGAGSTDLVVSGVPVPSVHAEATGGTETLSINCGSYQQGDVNGNGEIDSVDALFILQFVVGSINSLPPYGEADVEKDKDVDSVDALLILQYVAGLITEFPGH